MQSCDSTCNTSISVRLVQARVTYLMRTVRLQKCLLRIMNYISLIYWGATPPVPDYVNEVLCAVFVLTGRHSMGNS